jgi:hypothetical protein
MSPGADLAGYRGLRNRTQPDPYVRGSAGKNGLGVIIGEVSKYVGLRFEQAGRLNLRLHSDRINTFTYLGEPDGNALNAFAAEPFYKALTRRTSRRTPNAVLRYIQKIARNQPSAISIAAPNASI